MVALRPTEFDLDTEDDAHDEEAIPTPRPPSEDIDIEPYQTPVALTPANRKNRTRAVMERKDTADELSDVEVVTMEMREQKKRKVHLID